MKRRFALSILLTILVLALAGCSGGSYRIRVGTLNSSDNSLIGNYTSFSGYYYVTAKFTQGETVDFHVLQSTNSGKLTIQLMDSQGNAVTELTKDQSVQIPKNDTYKIRVDGDKHSGSFMVTWQQAK